MISLSKKEGNVQASDLTIPSSDSEEENKRSAYTITHSRMPELPQCFADSYQDYRESQG